MGARPKRSRGLRRIALISLRRIDFATIAGGRGEFIRQPRSVRGFRADTDRSVRTAHPTKALLETVRVRVERGSVGCAQRTEGFAPIPTARCAGRGLQKRSQAQALPGMPYLRRRLAMAVWEVCRRAASCRLEG